MSLPLCLTGIGTASLPDGGGKGGPGLDSRLSAALATLPPRESPVRLFHPIEALAFLAAYDAVSLAHVALPAAREDLGIVLGVDEGIDGIKARYYQGVLRDGPLGASPMAFPLMSHRARSRAPMACCFSRPGG